MWKNMESVIDDSQQSFPSFQLYKMDAKLQNHFSELAPLQI